MPPPEREFAPARAEMGWRRPRENGSSVLRYVETIRQRIWFVIAVTVLTIGVAVVYLSTAEKTYEAQAEMLVTPVSENDTALTGLALVRSSSDPTRDVETVAKLITSRDVAARVKKNLSLEESAEAIGGKVSATPVAQSDIVVITAEDSDPQQAAMLANGFAEAALEERDSKLREQLKPLMAGIEARLEESSGAPATQVVRLENQLARLETLNIEGDPTIRLETKATAPNSPVAPRPALTLLAGLIGGLVLGIGGAFLMQAVDPRLRREDQLRDLYSLPILARIPNESDGHGWLSGVRGRHRRSAPLGPSSLSPRTFEAYRTLRAMLSASQPEDQPEDTGRTIMVTGASPVEGKTTTAINLAASYVLAGKRVILIEADFRRPTVSTALGVTPSVGIGDVLLREVDLADALVGVKPFGASLQLLPVQRPDANLSELMSMPAARRLLDETRAMADCVIIDSPPLTEVADTLPVAQLVDDLLLVCRVGRSSLSQLARLADLLEQNGIAPRGFVLVGVAPSPEGSYYLEASGAARRLRPERPAPKANSGPPRRATRR